MLNVKETSILKSIINHALKQAKYHFGILNLRTYDKLAYSN